MTISKKLLISSYCRLCIDFSHAGIRSLVKVSLHPPTNPSIDKFYNGRHPDHSRKGRKIRVMDGRGGQISKQHRQDYHLSNHKPARHATNLPSPVPCLDEPFSHGQSQNMQRKNPPMIWLEPQSTPSQAKYRSIVQYSPCLIIHSRIYHAIT